MTDIKLSLFGQWLTERVVQYRADLFATCANDKVELPSVKRKFGQLEAYQFALEAFKELVDDHEKFQKERLDIEIEEEESKEQT